MEVGGAVQPGNRFVSFVRASGRGEAKLRERARGDVVCVAGAPAGPVTSSLRRSGPFLAGLSRRLSRLLFLAGLSRRLSCLLLLAGLSRRLSRGMPRVSVVPGESSSDQVVSQIVSQVVSQVASQLASQVVNQVVCQVVSQVNQMSQVI